MIALTYYSHNGFDSMGFAAIDHDSSHCCCCFYERSSKMIALTYHSHNGMTRIYVCCSVAAHSCFEWRFGSESRRHLVHRQWSGHVRQCIHRSPNRSLTLPLVAIVINRSGLEVPQILVSIVVLGVIQTKCLALLCCRDYFY